MRMSQVLASEGTPPDHTEPGAGRWPARRLPAALAPPHSRSRPTVGASPHGFPYFHHGSPSFLAHFSTVTNIASTVPANGDVNPYGITVVPQSIGRLVGGDTLVSNFNDSKNLEGTGTTMVEVALSGAVTTFAQLNGVLPGACPGGVGLSTALTILPGGWVVVGSLPTRDGTSATAAAGCLIVLNSAGTPVETRSGGNINGPWDLTAISGYAVQRSLSPTSSTVGWTTVRPLLHHGTVVRLDVRLKSRRGTHVDPLDGDRKRIR